MENRPLNGKPSGFHMSLKNFDWKAAGFFAAIGAAALLWWLSQTFITRKEYDEDQNRTELMLREIRSDVKDLLKK